MPKIRCVDCGEEIFIDPYGTPYKGELACPRCGEKMSVCVSQQGSEVKRKYPSLEDIKEVWGELNPIEKRSLQESSLSLGVRAYTASELMALRALESLLRRIYNVNETLGSLIKRMEKDARLTELSGIFSYFKDVRNRVAHPEKTSSKLGAESTFQMTKRLFLEVLKKMKE